MSFEYIRKTYNVPAKRGQRVEYTGCGKSELGTITSATGGQLRIRLDGMKKSCYFHPTWKLKYIQQGGNQ